MDAIWTDQRPPRGLIRNFLSLLSRSGIMASMQSFSAAPVLDSIIATMVDGLIAIDAESRARAQAIFGGGIRPRTGINTRTW